MKSSIYLLIFFLLFQVFPATGQDLISGKYSKEQLSTLLLSHQGWTPFPKLSDRQDWSKADKQMMQGFLTKANTMIDYDWPSISATKSLLIERTGDRNEYQAVSFKKREVLGTMLLAEIYENEGRFIDPIINGIWSVCEESFWGVPAHLPKTKEYSGLMDVSRPFVDLFAAETGTFLAWIDYFLGEKLDEISPQIRKRIYHEVNYRLLTPLMNQHHGWMAADSNGRPPNNWNPWICSNWINTVLLLEKDDNKRTDHVYKALGVLDQFLNPYPEDGGCDEGPSYWGAAAASLYDNLSLLNLASNDSFRYVFEDEKVKNMGQFIYRAQISETYFLNFADADPQPKMSANMIYRYGKDIQDPEMMRFGAFYREPEEGNIGRFHYFRNFFAVFMQEEFQNAEQGLPLPKDVWLPDTQVMVARDKEGSTDGFFLAAKGGHNEESHNHNDIGNYVVFYNGMPLLIDVGRGTYTRKTFGDQRYDIWYNRSDYHNLPTINQQTQQPGANFKARDIKYDWKKNSSKISLDIAGAYAEEAGVSSWNRTLELNRGRNVIITDEIAMDRADAVTQHLMTVYPSEIVKPGELAVHYKNEEDEAEDFVVLFDAEKWEVKVEKVKLEAPEDEGVRQKWGDNIYRINFERISPTEQDKMEFVVRKR